MIQEIDLGSVSSETGLLQTFATGLRLPDIASRSWKHFLQALTQLAEPRHIVLKGLRTVELRLPGEVKRMMKAIADHNNLHPESAVAVELGRDYRSTVLFLQFEARLRRPADSFVERAYISCWIKSEQAEEAKKTAAAEIDRCGWDIVSLEQCYRVDREDYADDSEESEYFLQSLVDGEVYVFDSWQEDA